MEECLRGCNELHESVYWAIQQKGEAERNKDDNPATRVFAFWLH